VCTYAESAKIFCVASSVVYVFDIVPKSHQSSSALEGGVVDNGMEVGFSDRQKTQLLLANSIVIDIICNSESKNSVFVVCLVIDLLVGFCDISKKSSLVFHIICG